MKAEAMSEYRAQVAAHSAPARGDDAWVRWVNRAADRLREIAVTEAAENPAGSDFALLLDDDTEKVRVWCAHHLLELFAERSPEHSAKALGIIEAAARGDSPAAIGERMWLEEWRRNHPGG